MHVFHGFLASRPAAGTRVAVGLLACLLGGAVPTSLSASGRGPATDGGAGLVPTAHRQLPSEWSAFWFVPEPKAQPSPEAKRLAEAVRRLAAGDAAGTLASLGPAQAGAGLITGYAHLTAGRALRQLQRVDEARARFQSAGEAAGESALKVEALVALADLALSAGDPAKAIALYEQAAALRPATPDAVQAGLLRAASAAGDVARARAAAATLYYEHAESPLSVEAVALVAADRAAASPARAAELDARELARADRLYDARRYAEAKTAYVALSASLTGEAAARAAVRAGASDFHLAKHRAAVTALERWLDTGPSAAEARYYHLRSLRALGERERYVALVHELAARHPDSPWAAEALNHLASYLIVDDQDDRAMEVFARVVAEHPTHRHAERAAWRLGWWHYRQGRFAEAAATFERGAANAPRSDYRPSWLYWSGRARERSGDREGALARYRVAVVDYEHSYYGRLAKDARSRLGDGRAQAAVTPPAQPTPAPAPPPRAVPPAQRDGLRALLAAGLLDFAADEVEFARRTWGNSAALEATLAWIHNQRGDLRRGIAAMRRAYPQFMAAGGDQLPDALQRVIFPVAYGGLIERYARQRNLDPFLVAALVAQESTFQADARSVANALGLMQILPSTGRKLARAEGLRRFSAARLTDPEFNVRLGTRYYAGLVNALGGDHLALASYNAGKSRVDRWLAERQGLPQDEFVDDIPFPETQNYVKRIIGTAEDYRRLYGADGLAGLAADGSSPKAVPAKRSTKGATAGKPRAPSRTRSVKPSPKPSSKAGRSAATGSAKKPEKKSAKKPVPANSPAKVSGGHAGADGRRG